MSALESKAIRIGRFIMLDLGTHKVCGIPTRFTSRVSPVGSLSEKLGLAESREAEDQRPPDARRSENTCV
jgi:hypothetical protein